MSGRVDAARPQVITSTVTPAPGGAQAGAGGGAKTTAATEPSVSFERASGDLSLFSAGQYASPVAVAGPALGHVGALPGRSSTYFGDKGNSLVPKDGQLDLQIKTVDPRANSRITKYADQVKLGDGKSVSARVVDDRMRGQAILIRHGANTLLARPDDTAGWKFYSKSPAGSSRNPGRGDIEFGKDSWQPVDAGRNRHLAELAEVYAEAQRVAEGGAVIEAPETGQPAGPSAAATRNAIVDVQLRNEKIADSLDLERRILQTASGLLTGYSERVGDAIKKGYVTMGTDRNGQMTLELTRPDGMSDGEWQKIRGEFGPKLAELQGIMNREQRIIADAIKVRNMDAAELYESVKSPAYLAHLRVLPPEDRSIALAKIANSLAGTPTGKEFARDFENAYFAVGRATGPLAGIARRDLASTANGRIALANTALAMAPHLGTTRDDAFAKAFEIITGRRPNERELTGIIKLLHADSPLMFQGLMARGADGASDTSDLVGALAEALGGGEWPKESAARKAADAIDRRLPGIGNGVEAAGGLLAAFGLAHSMSELAERGASFETIGGVATDATNAFSTWMSIAENANQLDKNGFLAKSGKVLGHTSNVLGLIMELHNVKQQSSDEGKYRAWVHAAASGLLVVGGLAVQSTPWGAAASAVGALVNLFYGRTSDSYESMHGTLKGSLN